MVGFTTISERLGEEGTYALIQPIYELMAGAVKEQGGSVKDFPRRWHSGTLLALRKRWKMRR
jgi:hypothetical protein